MANVGDGGGKKADAGKVPISLVPYEFIEGVARVMQAGAAKYDAYNWARGMDWSRIVDAAYRHLGSFEKGEDTDPETGLSHMLHLTCCAMFLYMYGQHNLGNDNRWKRPSKIS